MADSKNGIGPTSGGLSLLTGPWHNDEYDHTLNFREDGTVTVGISGDEYQTTYRCEESAGAGDIALGRAAFLFKLNGEQLELSNGKGKTIFTRGEPKAESAPGIKLKTGAAAAGIIKPRIDPDMFDFRHLIEGRWDNISTPVIDMYHISFHDHEYTISHVIHMPPRTVVLDKGRYSFSPFFYNTGKLFSSMGIPDRWFVVVDSNILILDPQNIFRRRED